MPAVVAAYLVVFSSFFCASGCVFFVVTYKTSELSCCKSQSGAGLTDVFLILLYRGELISSLFNKEHFPSVQIYSLFNYVLKSRVSERSGGLKVEAGAVVHLK